MSNGRNGPDQYGMRSEQRDISKIAKLSADAIISSSEKAATDVLAAAEACEGIARILRQDAEQLAGAIREHGHLLRDRVLNYGEVSKDIATSFLQSRDRILGLAKEVAAFSPPEPTPSREGQAENAASDTGEDQLPSVVGRGPAVGG